MNEAQESPGKSSVKIFNMSLPKSLPTMPAIHHLLSLLVSMVTGLGEERWVGRGMMFPRSPG